MSCQARDTKKIYSALRNRTHLGAGLNLKVLQKPYTEMQAAAARQAHTTTTAQRVQEQRASHVQAKAHVERNKLEQHRRLRVQKQEEDFKLQLASLRNRTPAARPESASSNPALAQLRHVRHDPPCSYTTFVIRLHI